MTVPPVGAGPSRVIVPTEDIPPTTVVGDKVKLVSLAGVTVNVVVCEKPANDAVIVAADAAPTARVPIEKVAVFEPSATVIDAGTVAFGVLETSATEVPPETANPLRVTVPVAVWLPTTLAGETVTELIANAPSSQKVPEKFAPPRNDTPNRSPLPSKAIAPGMPNPAFSIGPPTSKTSM